MRRISELIIMTLVAVWPMSALAQQSQLTLERFFETVLARSGSSHLPSALDTAQVFDQILSTSPTLLKTAIPKIDAALRNSDPDVRRCANVALLCIDQRPDSATLLLPLVPSLLDRLNDPDPQITAQAVRVINSMKPEPPESVIRPFVEYLGRKEARSIAGPAVVFALVRLAPDKQGVSQAITQYLASHDLAPPLAVDTLNALGFRSNPSLLIVSQVIEKAGPSQNQEVRLAAIHALTQIRPTAVKQAKKQLAKIGEAKDESQVVRNAAQEALQTIDRPKVK